VQILASDFSGVFTVLLIWGYFAPIAAGVAVAAGVIIGIRRAIRTRRKGRGFPIDPPSHP